MPDAERITLKPHLPETDNSASAFCCFIVAPGSDIILRSIRAFGGSFREFKSCQHAGCLAAPSRPACESQVVASNGQPSLVNFLARAVFAIGMRRVSCFKTGQDAIWVFRINWVQYIGHSVRLLIFEEAKSYMVGEQVWMKKIGMGLRERAIGWEGASLHRLGTRHRADLVAGLHRQGQGRELRGRRNNKRKGLL
jgi:hypothetical protein